MSELKYAELLQLNRDLGRQLGGHKLLGPAFDQWLDPAAKEGQKLGFAGLFNGLGEEVGELRRIREQPGGGDRQQ